MNENYFHQFDLSLNTRFMLFFHVNIEINVYLFHDLLVMLFQTYEFCGI